MCSIELPQQFRLYFNGTSILYGQPLDLIHVLLSSIVIPRAQSPGADPSKTDQLWKRKKLLPELPQMKMREEKCLSGKIKSKSSYLKESSEWVEEEIGTGLTVLNNYSLSHHYKHFNTSSLPSLLILTKS